MTDEPTVNNPSSSAKRPQLSARKKLLFSLIPLIGIVAVTEAAFRLYPNDDHGLAVGGLTEPDKDLIWKLKPRPYGILATNELDFRDGPYQADADIKILLLGDSVAWADGICDQKFGFAAVLETQLAEADPMRTYEIINSGVPGYSTFQQARYLARDGFSLDPDMILLQFCLNDVTSRYRNVMAYGGDNVFMGVDTRKSIPGLMGFLVRHSCAVEGICRLIQNRGRKEEAYRVEKLTVDQLTPQLEQAWTLVEEELSEIQQLAKAHDVPLLMMIAPYRFQVEDPDPRSRSQPQNRLLAWAAANGVTTVDLLPGFVNAPEGQELFNPNDQNHFSRDGHVCAAELLSQPTRDLLSAHVFPKD